MLYTTNDVNRFMSENQLFCDLQRYVYREKRMILITHLYVSSVLSIPIMMHRENHVSRVRLIVLLRAQDSAARVIVSVRL